MIKTRSKKISLLLVLMMLATMFVGVGTASAAGNITALSTPTVADDPNTPQTLGAIKVTIPAGSVQNTDSVIFKLPAGFDFNEWGGVAATKAAVTDVNANTLKNGIVIPAFTNAAGNEANGLVAANITATVLDANDEIQLTAAADQNPSADFVFYVYLEDIEVEDGTTEDCVVTFDGPANSGFAQGTVMVGKSAAAGNVVLSVSGEDTSNNNFNFDLRVKEDTADSFAVGLDALELELPDGYVWTTPTSGAEIFINSLWGDDIWVTFTNEDEELDINFVGIDDGVLVAGLPVYAAATDIGATTRASAWEIAGLLAYTVDDESDITAGAVNMQIKGESTSDISEAKVGTYGDYSAAIATEDVPTIIAGQSEQEIADIVITEAMRTSLQLNRTIIITLPSGARWQPDFAGATATPPVAPAALDNFDTDEALRVNFSNYTGADNRGAKFTVAAVSTGDEAEIVLEDVEVALEAGFSGDLVATVSGSAGLSGEITLAKAATPFTATAEGATDVVIGLSGQAAADFTLTENVAGAFVQDQSVNLDLPGGVIFAGTPTVEVTAGDVKITNVRRTNGDNTVTFDIDNDSDTPSTVKVSNIKLKLDRTVAEGAISLSVQGLGAVETAAYPDWTNSITAAKATIANVVTSAGYDVTNTAVFTFGDTNYTVNGVIKTMDVAPYAANNRTYMPIRYVAYALGIDDSNIIWDQTQQTVTLIKGDKVVQLKLNSNVILINGATVTMDVTVEASNGRTFLPAAWVAQAFGATATWDATANTVTIK